MPSRTCQKGQSVFVYYEIHSLVKDEFGQTNYNVSYTITSRDTPGRVAAFLACSGGETGRREELAVTYEQQGDAAQEVEYVELELENRPTGKYLLKVRVRDQNSGETAGHQQQEPHAPLARTHGHHTGAEPRAEYSLYQRVSLRGLPPMVSD